MVGTIAHVIFVNKNILSNFCYKIQTHFKPSLGKSNHGKPVLLFLRPQFTF